jgi:imidazolonepropionase-like amidohydrolase
VYPSPTATPIDDATVVIEGGRIVRIGPRAQVRVPPTARIIDCPNKVLVAGFQNSHVHFSEPHWAGAATQPAAVLTSQLQRMLTRYGFTTVVDTGSFLSDTTALRRRIESGEVEGPRILTAGLPLYPPNGIPYYIKDGSIPADLLRQLPQPGTASDAVREVARNLDGGADIVKLFTGSWGERGCVLPMPETVAIGAVQEAHRRGALVFAHTSSPAGLEVTLTAGVDVVAHALDDTRGLTPDHLRRMMQARIALVPTLTLFADDAQNAPAIFKEVADYAAQGGDILFGTDVGYHQMYDTRLEYASLGKAGLNWRQILASLTTTAARRFNESSQRGQLAEGMAGDVVVLGDDPQDDIHAFADVHLTIRSGRIIYGKELIR